MNKGCHSCVLEHISMDLPSSELNQYFWENLNLTKGNRPPNWPIGFFGNSCPLDRSMYTVASWQLDEWDAEDTSGWKRKYSAVPL